MGDTYKAGKKENEARKEKPQKKQPKMKPFSKKERI
jgi:hypothetical protein